MRRVKGRGRSSVCWKAKGPLELSKVQIGAETGPSYESTKCNSILWFGSQDRAGGSHGRLRRFRHRPVRALKDDAQQHAAKERSKHGIFAEGVSKVIRVTLDHSTTQSIHPSIHSSVVGRAAALRARRLRHRHTHINLRMRML